LDRPHLPDTGVDGDRITFEVVARSQRLKFSVIERPEGNIVVD